MGRDWLQWGGRGSSRRGRMAPEDSNPGGGCMCAVFHLFYLHPFQFPLNQHQPDNTSFLNQEANSSKGIEAPRNSLETEEATADMNLEQSLNFPGGLHIKTRVSTKQGAEEICSSSCPGTSATTPSLVARLMGLDVLPQCTSPSSSSLNSRPPKKSYFSQRKERAILGRRSGRSFSDDDISVGVHSLPETPRMSLARRSDVECQRLSLNVNKENVSEEFTVGKRKGRFRQDEDRSPGYYAKQIVNQVRENMGRRVGIDVTNISRNTAEVNVIRRDENLIVLKSSKNHFKVLPNLEEGETKSDEGKLSLIFSDIEKNKPALKSRRCHKALSDTSKSIDQAPMQEHHQHRYNGSNGKFPPRVIRNKKEEQFVHSRATDKKFKKAPLLRELLKTNGPTHFAVKKSPSPPATKLPQKQTEAASDALASKRNTQLCNSKKIHPYNLLQPASPDRNNRLGGAAAAEYRHYIERILKRAGIIDRVTPLKLGKWHTPSHPLDPSIFYYIELFHPANVDPSVAPLSRWCNRKLIFQLVDELLAEILKPHLELKPWCSHFITYHRLGLIDELCKKIEGFPAANCQFIEDIDSLIDKDLSHWESLEDERAKLAREIEGEIICSLLNETVTFSASVPRNSRGRNREPSRGFPRE